MEYLIQQIESNARLIKWSDGSYQLAIGDKLYDVEFNKLNDTLLYSQCKVKIRWEFIYSLQEDIVISQKNIDEKATLHYAGGDVGYQFEF